MGLFTPRNDEGGEREAVRRHRDAQQRLADARRHQQERHGPSMGAAHRASYPEGSWRKEFELYVVKKGDTLSGIARQVYADGDQWHRIQQANPIVLKNPDLIHPGLVLRIPKGEGQQLA
jgi:nucleoid-associated protein YgaU